MTQTVDVKHVKSKILERLKPSGWAERLEEFFVSDRMDNIIEQLLKESNLGFRLSPPLKLAFRAFEECRYGDLKVVIVAREPYPDPALADGLPFSCQNVDWKDFWTTPWKYPTIKQLKMVLEEVHETVYPHLTTFEYKGGTDLTRWAKQGVLMLNPALTGRAGSVGKHFQIWEEFIKFVISTIDSMNWGVVWGFWGDKAQAFHHRVNEENHYKLFCEHPWEAAGQGRNRWDSNDFFNTANRILWEGTGAEIQW